MSAPGADLTYTADGPSDQAAQAQAAMRGAIYGEVVNHSLLALFRPGHRILDIGCGTGAWASELRAAGARRITGIEISPTAADQAAARYDEVIRDPIETVDLSGSDFDTIVVADVLEHLVDPWAQLARWAGWAAPRGELVVSVPNLQAVELLVPLARGRFTYRDGGGMMDRTHLRWFTHGSMAEALRLAGWTPLTWGRPKTGKRGAVDRLTGHVFAHFLQSQIQVVARRSGR